MAARGGCQVETALEPIDAEDAIRRDVSTEALKVYAPPVPRDLSSLVPCAVVRRIGGVRASAVMDSHDMELSVWAGSWTEAMRCANALAGRIARLPSRADTSVQWRTASITSLPSNAPDPAHPSIPRVQFTANVTCRTLS